MSDRPSRGIHTLEEALSDGGPAFAHGNSEQGGDPGMSLRDYFAAAALTGLISSATKSPVPETYGLASYLIADAMLKARKP